MPLTADRLWQDFRKAVPSIEFEHVVVTFPSTADQDAVIATILRPTDPEDIFYRVVDIRMLTAPAVTPCVYRDVSSTRRPWSTGTIVLRCNVADITCELELFTKRDRV